MRINNLLDFINQSPNSFYACANIEDKLESLDYKALDMKKEWQLEKGGKYYVNLYESSCIAFEISKSGLNEQGFKIITAHTDSPSIKVKPNPEIAFQNYMKLNCEIYGGPILSTWLDRPLGLAGRVAVAGDNPLYPQSRLINLKKPLLVIPNLAIHMNREVNKGVELNKQTDMLPVMGLIEDQLEKENYLYKILAEELEIEVSDILDFDLYVYPFEEGCTVGAKGEFVSAGRLDDLAMVSAGLDALATTHPEKGINVLVAFDNEEIGSHTKQGADSPSLIMVLERIAFNLGVSRDAFISRVYDSFMISADMAHAIHPNRPEKHDPVNKPQLNKGPVLKYNANYKYPTDSMDTSVIESLCRGNEIPLQKFVNRSDELGGSTIGAVSAGQLPVRTVDLGMPMLAMHSSRELIGCKDYEDTTRLFEAFFSL